MAKIDAGVVNEVRAASGLLPELASIVSDYVFGTRFYVLRTDDSTVDDAQRAAYRASPLRTQWGGFEPTRVHLLEHTRACEGGKWRPMTKRLVVSDILSTYFVHAPPQLLHIDNKLYIVESTNSYNPSNTHGNTDEKHSIYSFDPCAPHEPVRVALCPRYEPMTD